MRESVRSRSPGRLTPRAPRLLVPTRRFIQCDVFSPVPTQGNGLAVVVDADGLSDAAMQGFAAWTNLAETAFLLPATDPGADYRVRIFTPAREMPFAGHPTLGSCAAWLRSGGVPNRPGLAVQQCESGLVEVAIKAPGHFEFASPPTAVRPMAEPTREAIVRALGIERSTIVRTAELDNGPVWQVFELTSSDAVLAAPSSAVRWPGFRSIGLIGPRSDGSDCDDEVRMLAPSSGMSEDPITGSLNAAIAMWRLAEGRLTGPRKVSQGTAIGRRGRVTVRPDGARVWIGGQVQVLIAGTVAL